MQMFLYLHVMVECLNGLKDEQLCVCEFVLCVKITSNAAANVMNLPASECVDVNVSRKKQAKYTENGLPSLCHLKQMHYEKSRTFHISKCGEWK